ncbi:hypothetical protein Tco_0223844 [Tanacetum coccineum]
MSNTNTNLQTQTSNALHNAIMEAGGKDHPPMLAPGNYVQWKSRIKRYIDTKPNNELIHYCLQNPPYKFKWTEKTVPVAEGSFETTAEGYMENYKNVSQDIRDQLNAKAEAVQIILIRIDSDIYSTVDACPNAYEMWKAIERLKQGESINVQDLETNLYWEFGKFTSRDGESLESYYSRFVMLVKQSQLKIVSYHKLYDIPKQHQNEVNEIRAERLTRKTIVNSSLPTYDQEPTMVAEDDEMSKEKKIDKLMALISLSFKKIYKPTNNNLKTSSNTSRENHDNTPRINRGTGKGMSKTKTGKGCSLSQGENAIEVTLDTVGKSGPIFDADPLQKVQNNDDNYNVFAIESEHLEQLESDDNDDLAKERDLLASLIAKLKCEIDDNKNRNKFWETSNKALVDKLKGEIEDFKTKNKSLESSNNHFKEANNELSQTNQLMFKDLKKFQDELEKRHDVNYMSKVELDCAKAKTDLMSYKMES